MAENIFAKGMLLILNFLFVGVGGGLIAVGVIAEMAVKELEEPGLAKYETVPIVFIAVGAIVFLVGFMGCCGAVADSNCILAVYAIFKILLMTLFLGAGIVFFVKQDIFVDYLKNFERDLFLLNEAKFSLLESKFQCCGPAGQQPTCCVDEFCDEYYRDCLEVTADIVHKYGNYVGGGLISVASLELMGAVTSLCLANILSHDKY